MADNQKVMPFFLDIHGSTLRFDQPTRPGAMGKVTVTHPSMYDGSTLTVAGSSFEFYIDTGNALAFADILRATMDPDINAMLQPNPSLFKNGTSTK